MFCILIMGLPGSGKTTLASKLYQSLSEKNISVSWYNADQVREKYNDWDFSETGRLRQASRMRTLAEQSTTEFVILDLVAPLQEMRTTIDPDFLVWVDTISQGRFKDTNAVFVAPDVFDIRVLEKDCDKWNSIILDEILNIHNKKGL